MNTPKILSKLPPKGNAFIQVFDSNLSTKKGLQFPRGLFKFLTNSYFFGPVKAFNSLAIRDFFLAALFLWMIFFLQAVSIIE